MNQTNQLRGSDESETGSKGFYYGWVVLISCFLIALASVTVRNSFGVFFKSIETAFDINRATTSGIMSLSQLVGCVVCIINGWGIDRYGPRKVLIVTGILTGAGMILTSQVSSVWQLYLSYGLLVALGSGGINTIIVATVSRWFTEKRTLALAIVTSSASLGMVLSTPISYLILKIGWQNAFGVLALITIALWIPGIILIKNKSKINSGPIDGNPKPPKSNNEDFSFVQVLKNNQFWICVCIWFLQAFCLIMVQTHIVPNAIDLNIDPVQAATILGLMGISNLAGRLIMAKVADRWNKKSTLIVCASLITAAMAGLPWASNLWQFYLFAIVSGFGFGGVVPSSYATVVDIFGLKRLGTFMGTMDASLTIGAAVGPALAGYLFDINGNYFAAFVIGFAGAAICTWLITRLKPIKLSAEA